MCSPCNHPNGFASFDCPNPEMPIRNLRSCPQFNVAPRRAAHSVSFRLHPHFPRPPRVMPAPNPVRSSLISRRTPRIPRPTPKIAAQRPISPLRRRSRRVICGEFRAISRRSRRQTRPRRVCRASRAAAPSPRPDAARAGRSARAAGVRCGILLGAGQSRVSLPIATRARARPVARGYRSASGRDWAPPIISGSSCETKKVLIASLSRRFL